MGYAGFEVLLQKGVDSSRERPWRCVHAHPDGWVVLGYGLFEDRHAVFGECDRFLVIDESHLASYLFDLCVLKMEIIFRGHRIKNLIVRL